MAQMLSHRKNVPTLSFERHNLVQQAEVLMKMNDEMMKAGLAPDHSDDGDEEPQSDEYNKLLLV